MIKNRKDVPADADTTLYSAANRGCTSFFVSVPSTAAYPLLVHVDGLHDADEYIPVAIGGERTFRYYDSAITRVVAQGEGGTSLGVTYGAVSKTRAV